MTTFISTPVEDAVRPHRSSPNLLSRARSFSMPPKAGGVLRTARGEVLRVKSPAEFFSENKNIAGFDNPGKSLYTTIRELVENSLDACEAAGVLPDIEITLHEIDKPALDKLVGVTTHERLDTTLFEKASKEAKRVGCRVEMARATDTLGTVAAAGTVVG